MTLIGYTMLCEQAGPKQLVRDACLAEEAGFDFAVISDHYFPWLDVQGHAPYAWSVLGAAAQATDRIPLMTYVTCPTRRYHPAVVAQKAATMQLLSEGRFTLGLGAGENLNEHIVGGGWPLAGVRHQMLEEAVEIIRALWAGGTVTYRGKHFDVEMLAPIGHRAARPQGPDDLHRLLEHLVAHAGKRPPSANNVLVQVLARAEPKREPSLGQKLHRRRLLRDDGGMITTGRAGHIGHQRPAAIRRPGPQGRRTGRRRPPAAPAARP